MTTTVPDDQGNPETPQPTPTRNITITVVEADENGNETSTKIGKAHIVCEHGNDIDAETEEVTGETGARGGSAVLTNVPDGTHTLTITATGYKTLTGHQIITNGNATSFTIALEKE